MNQQEEIKYTATNDSVAVIIGGKPTTVKRGAANFVELKRALVEGRWADAKAHLRADVSLRKWARDRFALDGNGGLLFDGRPVPSGLTRRIQDMAVAGADPSPLFRFWERMQNNPSMRSVEQLWSFLEHAGIPLTGDGCFLAYKGVKADFMDCHSGTILNAPGSTVQMQRNLISDNPDHACHQGLHVGAFEYATNFGPNVVIVKVDPADVVCVPNDHSHQKMRVCRYEVVGLANGDLMPSGTIDDSDLPKIVTKYDGTTTKTRPEVKVPRQFAKIHAADQPSLLSDFSTDELRSYASQVLKIVGASRILGGKVALVEKIMAARG